MPSLLEDVAVAILDGTPVDWSRVESTAGLEDRSLIEQLKTLDALRLVARRAGAPEPVASWGPLRVFERIGRGAFGDVHRAWDTRLDREVALKLLPSASVEADAPGSSIIEEGRLLARVRHPNVATIYGAERIDGRVGLWMELIHGRTLEQALDDGTTFTPGEVLRLGVELCRAVAAVHAAGLLHRDIKAQNVMLDDTGRLVLMDFGTGLDLDATSRDSVTGTPLYLAPEVLAGGTASEQSDVYSVGVVLYHLLTRAYPVQGRDLADLRRAHEARAEAELPPQAGQIPQLLRRVIARALDPNPERRHRSADALAEALSHVQHPPGRRRVAYVAAAAIVTLLTAVGWVQRQALAAIWSAPALPASVSPAVAVMPFKNLSPEPDSDYFVDGLTNEVIRNMAAIDGLQVRSQTSSFVFRDKPRDLHMVGDQLRVNLVLEGDVLRVGNRLRINVQLVRVPDDVPIWSERFDRTLDDVFAIQEEISRAIVNKLRLSFGQGQRRYQTNLPTYEAYLRARTVVSRRGTENALQAARLFEQVIAADSSFAPAYAGLADAYAEMSWQLTGLSNTEGLEGMRPAAERALEIDPLLAEAHAAMGITYARERDWERAAESFERALERNPSLPQILVNYVETTLIPTGQLDKAFQRLDEALIMDPLSPMVHRELGWALFIGGRFEEAITSFRAALAADPSFPFTSQGLARALTFAGSPEKAIDVWTHKPASDGDWERWLAQAYVRAGRRADLERLVKAHRDEHPYRQALIYSALGDVDRTFDALNKAVDEAPHRTAQMLAYPEMALLRGDPRLDALRKRLNLQ